jgi:short chain dehydrogenase
MPLEEIRPEVVMITGASAGVGRAVAQAFGSRGASVGLFARGRAGLEAAARDVAAAGGRALILKGDVADSDRVEEAVWAADHPRREYLVGFSTVEAILGDRVAAGRADRYLARHGYDAQQTSEPEDPQRPHNLWSPVDDARDFGAHGRFDRSARASSLELVVSKHHRVFAALGVALAAATLVYFHRAV